MGTLLNMHQSSLLMFSGEPYSTCNKCQFNQQKGSLFTYPGGPYIEPATKFTVQVIWETSLNRSKVYCSRFLGDLIEPGFSCHNFACNDRI